MHGRAAAAANHLRRRERIMPIPFVRLSLAVLLTTIACASAATSTPAAGPNRSVITEAEIPTQGTESAFDLIQRLRPEYLRIKPAQGANGASGNNAPPPVIMMNGQRTGEIADLRSIPAPSLSFVRYYGIEEAKRKFGMQFGGGAIEITYRTR
jgi:hypothetical protein